MAVARHALQQLRLERVLLMPASTQPLKPPLADAAPAQRLRMCELAAAGVEGVAVCGVEVERGGTSYTADTLEAIHARRPDVRLTFIVGADTALTLLSWRRPERVVELASIAVAVRSGCGREEVLDALAPLYGGRPEADAVSFLTMGPVDVSSSDVRARVARGEPIAELVAPAVAEYIAEHGLYRAPIGAAS